MAKLGTKPLCLTRLAYEWCSAIFENREKFEDWESPLLNCLELGFRHLDTLESYTDIAITHTEHHRGLVDVVFKSQKSEVIADFLHAWTTGDSLPDQAGEMVGVCTGHLVDLHNLVPFSPRLQRYVLRFVRIVGYKGFEGVGVGKLVELLNHLQVGEIFEDSAWISLLMDLIRSSEGTQRLSYQYWEGLAKITFSESYCPECEVLGDTDAPKIAMSLIEAEEWDKLERWIEIAWMLSKLPSITEEDLENSTLLLFRHRSGAAQRLEQWMERWSREWKKDIPESFQRILTRAHEAIQQQDAP